RMSKAKAKVRALIGEVLTALAPIAPARLWKVADHASALGTVKRGKAKPKTGTPRMVCKNAAELADEIRSRSAAAEVWAFPLLAACDRKRAFPFFE
ncbi:hypothetical protein OVX45_27320, partial [Klebsiella pneumoniae]|uniref:hypothetical protein n=1 Tax=Klebsiella pneumoniae TaxID=573 RepID=UPI002271FC83